MNFLHGSRAPPPPPTPVFQGQDSFVTIFYPLMEKDGVPGLSLLVVFEDFEVAETLILGMERIGNRFLTGS